MNSQEEETWEKLDAEFDHYLVDMKPFVLKLQHKSERQRCALWIKKLCEPSGAGSGFTGRKNRNMYAKLLLHMLKRGLLEGPFTHRPEGVLKTLPSYMSIYFDEPNAVRARNSSQEEVPDWVMSELGSQALKTDESWRRAIKDDPAFASSPIRSRRQRYSFSGKLPPRSHSMSSIHKSDDENVTLDQRKSTALLDDSNIEARLNSWNLGISPKTSLGKMSPSHEDQSLFRMHEKELEIKTKILEAKFHEEKLQLQQKHDVEVQKILDRKNSETEELKMLYRNKQNESEETIRKLEKKVQTLVRESQVIRESKERQIAELKKMCEQSTESVRNEWEKKLHMAVAEMEHGKLELQHKHTENIQALLDDTNARLIKMEADYLAQTEETNQMVKELEARVQQLTVEAESSNLQRLKLSQEKADLEKVYRTTCSELQDMRERHSSLQKEKDRVSQDYELRLQQLQSKYDSDMNFITQDHATSAAKASEVIEELEQCVSQLKQQLQESEHQRQQQLRDKEIRFQQELLLQERLHEKKVHAIQSELDQEKGSAQKKAHKLEEALKEKEEQLTRVTEIQRLQAQQADTALEEFKRQVELNSQKVYAEMKEQMGKVESDLSRSKSLREKQAKEFSLQLDEMKQRYEKQIVELKLEHEQMKAHLFQQHNKEKDCLVQDHEREIEKLEKQIDNTMQEYEEKAQEQRMQDAQTLVFPKMAIVISQDLLQEVVKTISGLEAQVHKLREELIQVNTQRKQQLMELGQMREEEKQKAARDHENVVCKLRNDMEKMKLDLQRVHASDMETICEKANIKLKQTEKEYSQKLAKSSQIITELQTTVATLREESSRQQLASERRLQDTTNKFEEEKRKLIRDNESTVKTTIAALKEESSRQQLAGERRLQDTIQKFEDEKRQLIRDHDSAIKVLQDAVENSYNQVRCAEMKMQHREMEAQEQVNSIRQECEMKVKGLMPMYLRQELEDTIASLKSQVNFLQKRASVLQEELSLYKSRR
ncbi:centrosomal protein of 112 kDa isoform X2 [Pleurodeles waltl]|uniref:centrosomal protein of 112 kDa isoform X2 n=1 Tax=Pleurodeles waltl TaxID=8319 RepID=UPI0037094B21